MTLNIAKNLNNPVKAMPPDHNGGVCNTNSNIINKAGSDKFEKNKNDNIHADNDNNKKLSKYAALGSALGALFSVIYFGKKQNPKLKADSLKNIQKILTPEYELKELVGVSTAAVIGAFAGSYPYTDKNDKKSLTREAVFQFTNMNLPTSLVALSMWFCDKKISEKYRTLAKIGTIAASVFGGVYSAVKISDFLKRNVFEKDKTTPPRKMSIDNFVVHADDLLGILVLAKVPFVRTFKLDTILPLLYARAGYEISEFNEQH